jgi:hypothetical protein
MALLPTIARSSTGTINSNFMSYPSELGTMDRHKHYVMFFVNKQSRSRINFGLGAADTKVDSSTEGTTLSIKRAPTVRLAQAIALYMPAQISMSHSANYGEQEIGALVAGSMSVLKTLNKDIDFGAAASELASKAAAGAKAEIGQAALKAADATIAPGALAASEIMSGKVRNNRTEMKFEGIGRRSFSFQFSMMPNNAKEAQTISDIVTAFRFHAMPEIDGSDLAGRTMIAPSTFDIEYKPNVHLHKISTSVLESVEVQYGGERTQFFVDDHPVQTNLTLNFKELEIITKERIQEGF